MEEHEPRNAFDIPKVFYFQVGNIHTGSKGPLRYRVEPADGLLKVDTWSEDLCYEIIREREKILAHEEFPVSEPGFDEMIDFLQVQYDQLTDKANAVS